MTSAENLNTVRGRVIRISSEPQRSRQGDYLFRGVELSSRAHNQRIFLVFPDTICEFNREDLYTFPLLCWEGAEIAAYGLHLSNELADGSVIYIVTPDSDLILEPFRPVSVTEAVEAAACLRSADLRNRVAPSEVFWMAKGRMIHALFGHIVRCVANGKEPDFEEAFSDARPGIMEVLPGSKVRVNEKELKKEAQGHFRNLKKWLEERRQLIDAISIEEDRFSGRFGLKGRTDAILYGRMPKTIVELKTGRALVEDHFLQLYAYSLLFSDDDGNASIDGQLFYSASGTSRILKPCDRADLLQGRNALIWQQHSYTVKNKEGKGNVNPAVCPQRGRCFSRSACRQVFGDVSRKVEPALQGEEKDYCERWFRLLSRELWETGGALARVLDPGTIDERIEQGVTLPVMEVRRVSDADRAPKEQAKRYGPEFSKEDAILGGEELPASPNAGNILVELKVETPGAEPAPGQRVILHKGDACSEDALRGYVADSGGGSVKVRLNAPFWLTTPESQSQSFLESFVAAGPWFLDTMPFLRGLEASRHALWGFFAKGDRDVIRIVVNGEEAPSSAASETASDQADDLCYADGLEGELNEGQEDAVKAALLAERFHLIHGPPGTGKTRVLARLVRSCLDRGERILVACPTNVALDRLLMALLKLGARDLLRVGSRAAISREFLDAIERTGNSFTLLHNLVTSGIGFDDFVHRVNESRLVAATAYQCATHPIFLRQRFDRVIVDEAGQLDEPSTLGVLALAPRFVLGGDHLQLPPVVQSSSGDEEGSGLQISLFERLFLSFQPSRISRLAMQYRMNNEIQHIPSRLFYDGMLVASPEAATRRLNIDPRLPDEPEMRRIIDPRQPVVFVDVHGPNSGKARPEEALVASQIVERLLTLGLPADEIGVITPYRAQQTMIRSRLAEDGCGDPVTSVDTVDRFQGGEKEVILLSLARSDGVTSFLADRKRLNVSLSRARSKLILLGHWKALEEHPLFASILDGLERVIVQP